MQLGLSTTTQRGWTVLHVDGEIDLASAPRLRQEVISLVADDRTRVVLDLSDVAFCDSTGMGVLVGAVKRARTAGGDVRVVCRNERLLAMFDITRLDRVFDLYGDVDAALDTGPVGERS